MKSDKCILYLSPLPPPAGGIASWMAKIVQYGLPEDCQVDIINTSIRGSRPVFAKARIDFPEIYRTLYIISKLLKCLLSSRYSVAHINSSLSASGVIRELVCAYLIRLRGIPLVIHYHGNLTDFPVSAIHGIGFWALKKLINMAETNIVLNRKSLDACLSYVQNPSTTKCDLVPNFIENSIFERLPIEPANHKRLQVIFVGGVLASKGATDIIDLAKQLPGIDFCLVGHVHESATSNTEPLSDNITLTGPVDYHEVLKMLSSSDVFLFPSYSEGFPVAVLEAMAIGLPVIGSDVGAIPEMIDDNAGGFIIRPGDTGAIIDAIRKLEEAPELRAKFSAYNKNKCRDQYSYSIVSNKLMDIYNDIILRAAYN